MKFEKITNNKPSLLLTRCITPKHATSLHKLIGLLVTLYMKLLLTISNN